MATVNRVKMELSDAQLAALRSRIITNSEPIPIAGCWVWMGSIKRNRDGTAYGRIGFRIAGEYSANNKQPRTWSAHVVSCIVFNDGIKMVGWVVAHRCHNPLCVNPDHLVYCSQSDNMKMSSVDGRLKRSG